MFFQNNVVPASPGLDFITSKASSVFSLCLLVEGFSCSSSSFPFFLFDISINIKFFLKIYHLKMEAKISARIREKKCNIFHQTLANLFIEPLIQQFCAYVIEIEGCFTSLSCE